jgi:hypothetical protein
METPTTTVQPFTYDTSIIDDGMKNEFQSIRLPFPHAQFRWHNGGEALQPLTKAGLPLMRHFGGWASIGNADDVKGVAESYGAKLPAYLVRDTLTSDDGKEYSAYVTRYVIVVPVVRRISWYNPTTKMRYSKPTKGASTRRQVLGLLGESLKTQNGSVAFSPLFPVVLNCKSYSGTYFDDAMNEWDRATREARKALHVSSPFPFWQAYGSFGDTRVVEQIKYTDRGETKTKTLARPVVLLPESGKVTSEWL